MQERILKALRCQKSMLPPLRGFHCDRNAKLGSLIAEGLKAGRKKARAEWRMSFLDLLKDERWHIFLPMTLTVDIPDDLAAELGVGFQNLGRAALEALAAEAYSKEVLSLEQIRRMLGLGSLWEAQAMLSRHAVWPDQSAEEILADARRSFEFRQAIA